MSDRDIPKELPPQVSAELKSVHRKMISSLDGVPLKLVCIAAANLFATTHLDISDDRQDALDGANRFFGDILRAIDGRFGTASGIPAAPKGTPFHLLTDDGDFDSEQVAMISNGITAAINGRRHADALQALADMMMNIVAQSACCAGHSTETIDDIADAMKEGLNAYFSRLSAQPRNVQ